MRQKVLALGIIAVFAIISLFIYGVISGKIGFAKNREIRNKTMEIRVLLSQPSLASLPLMIAQEKGFFRQNGLNVTLRTDWDQDNAVNSLVAGETDFLCARPEVSFYQSLKGGKTKPVMIAQICKANGFMLVTRKTEKPFSWQELQGKIVLGYKDGELPELIFENTLKKNKLKPFLDVSIICNLSSRLTPGAFSAGTAQGILVTEPFCSRLEKENSNLNLTPLKTDAGELMFNVLMVSEWYPATHQEICRAMLTACTQSLQWLEKNSPEEIIPILRTYFSDDEKTLLRAVGRYKTLGCWPTSPNIEPAALERLQDLLLAEKELLKKIQLQELSINF